MMANDAIYHREAKAEVISTDAQDFEQIIADNETRIFNTIHSFIGDYDEALDLTQETFIRAYRSIEKFRWESSISTWLYRIAINLCKKSHSKRTRQNLVFPESLDDPEVGRKMAGRVTEGHSATEILEANERQNTVRREIYALPKRYRSVIILKYLQELSYEEIANILGCSIGTVKSRLSRAKAKMKQRLEQVMEADHGRL